MHGNHPTLACPTPPASCPAGVAGAVSRTATAPIDRLKMLLQIQDCSRGLTIQEGIRKMTAEGERRGDWWMGGGGSGG